MSKRKKISFTRSTLSVIDKNSERFLEVKENGKASWWTPFIGLFLVFSSSSAFLISHVFVKKLKYISPGQLSTIRNIGLFIGNLPIAIYSTRNILGPKEYFWLLLFRSFIGATALYLNLMCFRYLPLAEAAIILATIPALVTLVAHFYLKEACGLLHVVSILLTAVGVLISIRLPDLIHDSSRTDFDYNYIIGLLSGFTCVIFQTFTCVALRKMKDIHFSVIQLYFGAVGTVENSVLTAFFGKYLWPVCGGWDTFQMILIAVLGFMGHMFITLALQKEAASIVSTSKSAIDIVLSSILQFMFFDLVPDVYTLGGGFLVISAISAIGFYKWLIDQPEDSMYKKRLRCLLRYE